jgi:hypothetical protein
MATCETCGNDYDKSFEVAMAGARHHFDCFECAIEALAPRCGHCSVRIVGHGVETHGAYFCGASCARAAGEAGLVDRN